MRSINPLNRAKTSIIQKQATISALAPINAIKEQEINESEEMTEDYSIMAKKATVNSNYFSQNSLRQKEFQDEPENRIDNGDMEGPYFCIKHPDRTLVYFCCQCYKLVCSKCMFHFHNGHELSQIADIFTNVTDNISTLGSEIRNVRKRISMSQAYLEKSIETINKMKDKQIKIIQDEFNKIITIVEERMGKQMNIFAARLQELKNVADTINIEIINSFLNIVLLKRYRIKLR